MKPADFSPISLFNDACRAGYIKLHAAVSANLGDPRQRAMFMLGAGIAVVGMVASDVVHAQASDGFAGIANTGAKQGTSIKKSVGEIFAAVGFLGAGYGGYNLWRKGKEGENSRISGGQIIIPLVGGFALAATGGIMIAAGQTIGLQASQMGVVP